MAGPIEDFVNASKLLDVNLTPGERESRKIMSDPSTETGRRYQSWLVEERNHEVTRLQSILDNPQATAEEKRVAGDMIKMYEVEL